MFLWAGKYAHMDTHISNQSIIFYRHSTPLLSSQCAAIVPPAATAAAAAPAFALVAPSLFPPDIVRTSSRQTPAGKFSLAGATCTRYFHPPFSAVAAEAVAPEGAVLAPRAADAMMEEEEEEGEEEEEEEGLDAAWWWLWPWAACVRCWCCCWRYW